jgi:hypothetical protein
MEKEIKIFVGGIYSMVERPKQVLVLAPNTKPLIFSNDRDLGKALESATTYIKDNLIK